MCLALAKIKSVFPQLFDNMPNNSACLYNSFTVWVCTRYTSNRSIIDNPHQSTIGRSPPRRRRSPSARSRSRTPPVRRERRSRSRSPLWVQPKRTKHWGALSSISLSNLLAASSIDRIVSLIACNHSRNFYYNLHGFCMYLEKMFRER